MEGEVSSLYSLFKVSTSYKKFKRVRGIFVVLARHGLADVAARSGLRRMWQGIKWFFSLGRAKKQLPPSVGERLREAFEEAGPTFVKFGQLLANRPDIIPPYIIKELSKLQDQVPPFPYEEARRRVQDELGTPLSDVFESFDETPLAAASIAQVHKARLKSGGLVAVKVMRAGAEQTGRQDLAALKDLARYLQQSVEELSQIHPVSLVEEFSRTMSLEMDFRNEVRNMERYARNFADEPELKVPVPYKEFCTSRVIVMEYLDGVKITQLKDLGSLPIEPAKIAEIGTRILLRSVFEHRFFHADPHPGNFLIGRDGKVCLLDFGMMGFVDESRMEQLLSFMVALVSYDTDMLVETILNAGLAPSDLDIEAFRRDVEFMMNQFAGLSLEEIQVDVLLQTAAETVFKHRVSLPTDLLMVGRALSTMEGIAVAIYPEFKPLEAVSPYLISLFVKRAINPSRQSDELVNAVADWISVARKLPHDLADAMQRLKKGEFLLRIEHKYHPKRSLEANRRTNRMVGMAMVLGLTASSFYLFSLPAVPQAIPIGALVSSFLLGCWVLWGTWRSGGM